MNAVILSKSYSGPVFDEQEILRYAGAKEANETTMALLEACITEIQDKLAYKVCYCKLPVTIDGDICNFGAMKLQSGNLARNLKGCDSVILFGATIGVDIDRLIARYGHIAPSKALMFQAIGTERIEALCDMFCADIAKEYSAELKPRFSPGYGDLSLTTQKEVFAILDCEKRIGLTLNDSLIMSPSKSVTAFVGLISEAK